MGKRGRPVGFKLSEESKRAIAESKRGQRQKQETRDKISRTLTQHFQQFNSLAEEITNKYCRADDDELCDWANEIKEELDSSENIFTSKTLRNTGRVELTSGDHIEYFSHSITPELLIMIKQLFEELGPDAEEILDKLWE